MLLIAWSVTIVVTAAMAKSFELAKRFKRMYTFTSVMGDINDKYIELVNSCLRTVVSQFYYRPYIFFNEVGFHQYCFSVFYRKKEFTRLFKTKEGKQTNLLHPEYPSILKFNRKNLKIGEGKDFGRAWYDMVILNPKFIENNYYDTVTNKNVSNIKSRQSNILALMEFKYIIKMNKNLLHELKWDYLKINNSPEAANKYMVVFSHEPINKDVFNSMKWDKNKKLVLAVLKNVNNKKIISIDIRPNNWLNLPKSWLAP